ncbi:Os02g0476700 [Oryza sativa Japonica Group]|jgi:hypothetical protein|uniref:Os02g0476700 protein n=1 Tax=Oryza sativa subsp. japonica TaxID=39947 RepID=A0A0P0VJ30_ORYSJ|nr:hypothetical protein EE612_011313 [Oryza sativa]BAS78658.1 Os02g0476700 [Oryza sativa Japonica Group]
MARWMSIQQLKRRRTQHRGPARMAGIAAACSQPRPATASFCTCFTVPTGCSALAAEQAQNDGLCYTKIPPTPTIDTTSSGKHAQSSAKWFLSID